MREQVTYAENRIRIILADYDVDSGSVLFRDDSVQCERKCNPLVVFNSAIVMGVEQGESILFVERILFEIKAGRVNVRTEDIHACLQRRCADVRQDDSFVLGCCPNLAARGELFAFADEFL